MRKYKLVASFEGAVEHPWRRDEMDNPEILAWEEFADVYRYYLKPPTRRQARRAVRQAFNRCRKEHRRGGATIVCVTVFDVTDLPEGRETEFMNRQKRGVEGVFFFTPNFNHHHLHSKY